jgi:uncharacterized membrane protein YoaK (UPF0700 family)
MTQAGSAHEVPLPRWVPTLLSFVAGYIDSYTFLALFGLFVAQVTGSFVTAGAELVTHDIGITGKVVAVTAFLVAAALTAGLIRLARERDRDALPWMLALETLLIAAFCLLMLVGSPPAGTDDWRGILAGLFGATAMGTQSVIVRLMMRGSPQTNVMTGNMTQLGIESSELFLAWRRRVRNPADPQSVREFVNVRTRLFIVLAIAIGFILGAACGAVAYARIGLPGAPLAVALVGALTLWAIRHERSG